MWVFGRDEDAAILWKEIEDEKNLLLLAPRRIGKTHLQHLMAEQAASHGYKAILLDVQGFGEEKDFLSQLCSAIQEELTIGSKVIGSLTHRLNKALLGQGGAEKDWRSWLLESDWKDFAQQLLAQLDEEGGDHNWLILIDELPIFVQELQSKSGTESISTFLSWLRRARLKYKSIRWILVGSIGLDTVARKYGLEGTINDLVPMGLEPFSEAVAKDFMKEIAARDRKSFSTDALDHACDRLGWLSPYYLERVAKNACTKAGGASEIDKKLVSDAMDQLLELPSRLYWASWRDHLDRNFDQVNRLTLYRILEEMSKRKTGCSTDHLIAKLSAAGVDNVNAVVRDALNTLENDGFVRKSGRNYRFRMNLLREWWLIYVVTS